MNSFDYDPTEHLNQVLATLESLDELPQLLAFISDYKIQLNRQIHEAIKQYRSPVPLGQNVGELYKDIENIRAKSQETQESVTSITSPMQELDNCKRNLVTLMTVYKRLQMLIDANNTLNEIVPKKNYKEVLNLFSVVKELSLFFKPYKSIPEINELSLSILQAQNKLVDDIFIDFEDAVTNKLHDDQLVYACEILEVIDSKFKDKLLNWFYNYQLKDIKAIFNNLDEAGSLENFNRRYIYFNNILGNINQNFSDCFPKSWVISLELSKIFCNITKQDLISLLNNSTPSQVLLESLTNTLDFEKNLNKVLKTNDFDKIILKVFEPYLSIWVKDQDKVLSSKFVGFYSTAQIPQEFIEVKTYADFLQVLKVNNIPNISPSSIELFKTFHKILQAAVKLSKGNIILDYSVLVSKYLIEFNSKVLLPLIPTDQTDLSGIEPIKYLTMMLNTGDYILNNIDDFEDKLKKVTLEDVGRKITFDAARDNYVDMINKTTSNLLVKVTSDLQFAWRHFLNYNWSNSDSLNGISNYMVDYKQSLINNISVILPLIIRSGYVRNICDKLVEVQVNSFIKNMVLIAPLALTTVEQISKDIKNLKKLAYELPLYSNPNHGEGMGEDHNKNPGFKSYLRTVDVQFARVEKLLDLLLVPLKPMEDFILNYFQIIGDKSERNFAKVLTLKGVDINQEHTYTESFKNQIPFQGTLKNECSILSAIQEPNSVINSATASLSPSKLPEPEVKSPMISIPNPQLPTNLNMNNIERNLRGLALSGENQVNKIRNFSKFFRKDSNGQGND